MVVGAMVVDVVDVDVVEVDVVEVEVVVLLDDDVVDEGAVVAEIDVTPMSVAGCEVLLFDPEVHDISNGAATTSADHHERRNT